MYRTLLIILGCILMGNLMAQDPLELKWIVVYGAENDPENLRMAEATVPGAVQLDIAKAEGYAPYYYGENWKDYLWMEDQELVYVTRFLRPGMKPGERLVFGTVGSNSNMEGPVMKAELPYWKSDGFTLHLEVLGHPEYSSDYTFLLSD